MRSGLVTGVHAQVDLKLINRPVQAMVAIRVRPPSRTVIHSFHAFITALPETLSVFVMSGNDNFLVHVAVRDNEQLNDFILDRLAQRKEITDVRTSIIFRHDQSPVVLPLREP